MYNEFIKIEVVLRGNYLVKKKWRLGLQKQLEAAKRIMVPG